MARATEAKREYNRRYYLKNKEKILAERKTPEYREKARVWEAKTYATAEGRAKRAAQSRAHYAANPGRRARETASATQWHRDHPYQTALTMKAANANQGARKHGCEGKLGLKDIQGMVDAWVPFECAYCSCQLSREKGLGIRFEIDHVIPLAKQGPNTVDNLVLCCRPCNIAKGNKIVRKY
jgi:5-methylcytosine-specific restriction endonuclease McrA